MNLFEIIFIIPYIYFLIIELLQLCFDYIFWFISVFLSSFFLNI